MLRNISINLLAQSYLFLLSFLTIPFILHGLGKELFGLFALTNAILGYATVFDFGFAAALTQRIAQVRQQHQGNEVKKIIQTGLLLYSTLAIFIALAINLSRPFLIHTFRLSPQAQPLAQAIIPLIALNTGLYFLTIFSSAVYQGLERFFLYNVRTFILGSANTLGVAILIWAKQPFPTIFQLQTASLLLIIAVEFWFLRSFFAYPHFSKTIFKKLARFASFKFLANCAGQINNQFPKFLLASLVSVSSVSYFTIPFSLTQKSATLLSQVYIVLFPKIAYLKGKKRYQHIQKIFFKSELIIAAVMLPFSFISWRLGPVFFRWWLKDAKFSQAITPTFNLLLLTFFLHALTAVPVALLEGLGNAKIPALLAWVNTAVVFALGPILIKQWGAFGAALTILAYTLISAPAVIFLAQKKLQETT